MLPSRRRAHCDGMYWLTSESGGLWALMLASKRAAAFSTSGAAR
jgi:hypothetical protein